MEKIIISESRFFKHNHQIIATYTKNSKTVNFGFMFYYNKFYKTSGSLLYLRRDIEIKQDIYKNINIIDIIKKMIKAVEKHYNIKLYRVYALDAYSKPEQPQEKEITRMGALKNE